MKHGKVWLAVAGLVENERGEWLVVKKKYGGLKGIWSLPAGFVEMGETADQAVQREVFEETGVKTEVERVIGIRTGVISNDISDNMIIFALTSVVSNTVITVQETEIQEAQWISKDQLETGEGVSKMIPSMIKELRAEGFVKQPLSDPGKQFKYTVYHLFL